MRGINVTVMLIVIITVALTSIVVVWTLTNANSFFETNEISSVKAEFRECNNKIIETARTGLSNTCIFPASIGLITGTIDDISYQIITSEQVCDQTPWVLIDPDKNLWQKCDVSSNSDTFSLKLNYSSIKFQFMSMGNVQVKGQSGHAVEVSRAGMNDTLTNLTLRVY